MGAMCVVVKKEPVTILRTKRKTLSLELKDDGLLVRAPKRMSNREIQAFILSKKDWIEKHQKIIDERLELQKQYPPYTEEELKDLAKKAKVIIPAGDVLAFIPSFLFRFLLGKDIPIPYFNAVGGSLASRYVDQ